MAAVTPDATDRLASAAGAVAETLVTCAIAAVTGYLLFGDPTHVPIAFLAGVTFMAGYRRLRFVSEVRESVTIIRRAIRGPR